MQYVLPFMTKYQTEEGDYIGYCFFFDDLPNFLTTKPTSHVKVLLPDYDDDFELDPIRIFSWAHHMGNIPDEACVIWDDSEHMQDLTGGYCGRFVVPRHLSVSSDGPLWKYSDFITECFVELVGIDMPSKVYTQNSKTEAYKASLIRSIQE